MQALHTSMQALHCFLLLIPGRTMFASPEITVGIGRYEKCPESGL